MDIMVSIVCNTYNHGKYIRDALEGFVKQKTNFVYEVLVYDDASKDETPNIIKEYENKYPELIKPIYQTVNQYSLGLKPGTQNTNRAKGKYIAFCEGDDYWIDENKLQKQVDYMECHPKCTFCFTNGYTRYDNELKGKVIPWVDAECYDRKKGNYNSGELELLGYIPTASFLYVAGLERKLYVPENAFKGDTYVKISASYFGYAHFINEPMVVYRRAVKDSVTATWNKNENEYIKACERFIVLFESLKDVTQHKYDDVFNMRSVQWEITKNYVSGNAVALKEIFNSERIKYLKKSRLKRRLIYYIKCKNIKSFDWFRKLFKRVLKGLNR